MRWVQLGLAGPQLSTPISPAPSAANKPDPLDPGSVSPLEKGTTKPPISPTAPQSERPFIVPTADLKNEVSEGGTPPPG